MKTKHLFLPFIAATLFATNIFVATPTASAQATTPAETTTSAQTTTPAPTDETAPPPAIPPADLWHFNLAFPIWLPGVGGDLTVHGHHFSPDQDTGDVIDILDTHFNMGAVVHFEAEKSRFGGIAEGMYLDLRATRNGSDRGGEASLKAVIGELDGFYTIIPENPQKTGFGSFRLDALGGVRISSVRIGLETDAFGGSVSQTLYDPIVGARMKFGLTDWLAFKLRGDVGGFGIDAWETSTYQWNIDTGLDFRLAKWCDLGLGWRWLKYDFASDSGNTKFDATISGPVVNLSFTF